VSGVAFAPDGQTLASTSHDSTVKLWQVSDGTLLYTLHGHTSWVSSLEGHTNTSWVRSLTFAPDGQILASALQDSTVKLWRVADGMLLQTLEEHIETVNSVAFASDGTTLASGSGDGTIRLWAVR
jgi:WD40 repeat protein